MNKNELRSLYRTVTNLTRRINKLEQQNRFTTSADWAQASWWGWVSSTQPASKIVNVRGGVFWEWNSVAGTGQFRKLDDAPYDFNGFAPFAAQYHYRWAVLQADVGASPVTLRVYDSAVEWGTSAECEADFWANGTADDLYGGYISLCVIVLRNDGNLVAAGSIENITLSDKEQSYLMVRDFRPWLHLHTT
jgi:hypothetical protein